MQEKYATLVKLTLWWRTMRWSRRRMPQTQLLGQGDDEKEKKKKRRRKEEGVELEHHG